jgi:hypothetical protein
MLVAAISAAQMRRLRIKAPVDLLRDLEGAGCRMRWDVERQGNRLLFRRWRDLVRLDRSYGQQRDHAGHPHHGQLHHIHFLNIMSAAKMAAPIIMMACSFYSRDADDGGDTAVTTGQAGLDATA